MVFFLNRLYVPNYWQHISPLLCSRFIYFNEIINLKRNTLDHGFIAQDIELLLPNLVNQYEKYKSIKYEKFTPYLVKGSQELYKLIQEQQKKIIDLQKQINMIKSQLS